MACFYLKILGQCFAKIEIIFKSSILKFYLLYKQVINLYLNY